MNPRVFVSSTVRDLAHVRHAIRDLVQELGYQPVMSEFGEVGYLPHTTAADSCYSESKECDLAVLIIGKRYGSDDKDEVSVTHNEYRALLASKTPIISLVERDLLTYRAVFEANGGTVAAFPGMDNPSKTFTLINEVISSPVNNGLTEFVHIAEARDYVRRQIAHLFCSLLRERGDPMKGEIRDVLAEIISLKQSISSGREGSKSNQFLRASRALLEDWANRYKGCLNGMFRSLESATLLILENETFDDVLKSQDWALEIVDETTVDAHDFNNPEFVNFTHASQWVVESTPVAGRDRLPWAGYLVFPGRRLVLTKGVEQQFRAIHMRIRAESV